MTRVRPLARPLLHVALIQGMLGWLYVAACASFRPGLLSGPVASVLPVRRDTFGVICFAASAVGYLGLHLSPRPLWSRGPRRGGPVDALLRTLACYPLLVWAYLCLNSLTHPQSIAWPLTHLADGPTEGTTAVLCFAVSAVALFTLRLTDPPKEASAWPNAPY